MRDFILGAKFSFSSPEWESVSDDAKDLIGHLIVVDPVKRWNADQALRHCWFTGVKTEEPPSAEETAATTKESVSSTTTPCVAVISPAATPDTVAAADATPGCAAQDAEKKDDEDEVYSSPVTIVFGSDDEDDNVLSQKAEDHMPSPSTESGDLSPTHAKPSTSLVARTPERPLPVRRMRPKSRQTLPSSQNIQTRDRLSFPLNDSAQEPPTKAQRTLTPNITHFFQPENKPGEK